MWGLSEPCIQTLRISRVLRVTPRQTDVPSPWMDNWEKCPHKRKEFTEKKWRPSRFHCLFNTPLQNGTVLLFQNCTHHSELAALVQNPHSELNFIVTVNIAFVGWFEMELKWWTIIKKNRCPFQKIRNWIMGSFSNLSIGLIYV